jgi:hypothetical protein
LFWTKSVPVRKRNAGVGGASGSSGNAGHHLEAHTGRREGFNLLAATAKNKGITTLEPYHFASLAGEFHQAAVDLILGQGVVSTLLAHMNTLGGFRNK